MARLLLDKDAEDEEEPVKEKIEDHNSGTGGTHSVPVVRTTTTTPHHEFPSSMNKRKDRAHSSTSVRNTAAVLGTDEQTCTTHQLVSESSNVAKLASKFNAITVDAANKAVAFGKSSPKGVVRKTVQLFEKDSPNGKTGTRKSTNSLAKARPGGPNAQNDTISRMLLRPAMLTNIGDPKLVGQGEEKSSSLLNLKLGNLPCANNSDNNDTLKNNIDAVGKAKNGCNSSPVARSDIYGRTKYHGVARPLSLAKDFTLESILNEDDFNNEIFPRHRGPEMWSNLGKPCRPKSLVLSKNSSFLHNGMKKTYSSVRSLDTTVETADDGDYTDVFNAGKRETKGPKKNVFITDYDDMNANGEGYRHNGSTNNEYEDVQFSTSGITAGEAKRNHVSTESHYHYIEATDDDHEDSSNMYDTVVYAQIVENYENVRGNYSSKVNGSVVRTTANSSNSSTDHPYTRDGSDLGMYSDSESSTEQSNSLYESRQSTLEAVTNFPSTNSINSELSSSTSNFYCCQYDRKPANLGDHMCTAVMDWKSSNSNDSVGLSDDWVDVNSWESDEDTSVKVKPTVSSSSSYKKRLNFGKLTKLRKKRFRSFRQHKSAVSVCSHSAVYIVFVENNKCEEKACDSNSVSSSTSSSTYAANLSTTKFVETESPPLPLSPDGGEFITVLRSVLYPLPNYESQEVTTLFSDISDVKNLSSEFPNGSQETHFAAEELCDDFDDSSSDEGSFISTKNSEEISPSSANNNHHRMDKQHSASNHSSQNIYGLVQKARRTVRKSWSSLNQIRKVSVGSLASKTVLNKISTGTKEFPVKGDQSGGSVRWSSFKTKLRPKYSTINSSSSIFYLNPNDLCFNANNESQNQKRSIANVRRRKTCIDLHITRPTSPPPPPPVAKAQENNDKKDTPSPPDHEERSSNTCGSSSTESISEVLSHPDLETRFSDEPLYQFYAESIANVRNLTTSSSSNYLSDSDGYEEIGSTTSSRPSAMELITPSPSGHGQCRSLWCDVPEVKNSGIPGTLSLGHQKLQEAKFEIITSEASYYKSLCVLDKIFANDARLKNESIITRNDWKILFGNVSAVKKCSEKLLTALETCWQESILLTGLCDVIHEHANLNFKIYIKYCSNQVFIDKTLKRLREHNPNFANLIADLESNPLCHSLTLHSFLMLPMQRITRMPLLVDAVLSKLDPITDKNVYKTYQLTLSILNKIVQDCNETARKLERYEEMLLLSRQLEFSRKDVKIFSIASSSRWLIRSGPMVHINMQDTKLTLTRKLTKQTNKLYFFLFNDILIIAKKKSDDAYAVLDYCVRNVMQFNLIEDGYSVLPCTISPLPHPYLLVLTILENHEGKTVEMVLSCDSDSTRQRWLEAASAYLTSDNPEEKLYEEWDCPQVSAVHSYVATQPDELSLHVGDIVKVLKKTTDGWYHGERIRDGVTGWFPGNYTVEIASQHTRAKNLKLRHRLLTISANYLQCQQHKAK